MIDEQGDEQQLAQAFVRLADSLIDDFDVVDLLHGLVDECVSLLDAGAAGLLLADGHGMLHVLASTSERTRLLELFQLEAGDGPCLECFKTARPVLVSDLTDASGRWPEFTARAIEEGFRSVHALPLRLRRSTIGALNLFHTDPGPMSAADLQVGQALADVATIGILQERAIAAGEILTGQLQLALNSRVIIEQAKGVLAERGTLDMEAAFERLRAYSRNRNLRLGEVARGVVEGSVDVAVVLAAESASDRRRLVR